MAKVYSPNKSYTGVSAGVSFINGAGETDSPHLLQWFKENGYTIEETTKKKSDGTKDKINEKPLEKMTVDQLKQYAEEKNIDISLLTLKDDILVKIKEAEQEK